MKMDLRWLGLLLVSALAAMPSGAATVILDWDAVTTNADGTPFADPAHPTASELSGYRLFYRASPLVGLTTTTAMSDLSVIKLDIIGNTTTQTLTTLQDGTSYYFRVTARDAANQSAFSLDVNDQDLDVSTFTPAPAAPINVGASATSSQQIQFAWRDNSGGEAGFRIERSFPGNSSYALLSSTSASAGTGTLRTLPDSGLTPQTTYYYRVRANGTSADSGFVEVFAVTPPAPTAPPVQPTNLRATGVTATQISLAWNDNSGDETAFELRWSLDGAAWQPAIVLPVNAASHNHGPLPSGTSYYYQVRAVNGVGAPAFAPATPLMARTTGGGTTPSGFTPPPGLKEAYCFPNPAAGVDPVIRAMMGGVDFVEVTIYDQSGAVAHTGRSTSQSLVNGEPAYEYRWTGAKSPGVYYAVIHGKKGDETIRARAKFAVVR